MFTWDVLRCLESEVVGDGGGDGEGGQPVGGADLVGVIALLKRLHMLPLKPPGGILPLRLHLADQRPGDRHVMMIMISTDSLTSDTRHLPVVEAPDRPGGAEWS